MMSEKEKMLNRVIAAILVGASMFIASTASAQTVCRTDQGKAIYLEARTTNDGIENYSDLRVVKEVCVAFKDEGYRLKGFPGVYVTREDLTRLIRQTFHLRLAQSKAGINDETMAEILSKFPNNEPRAADKK